MLKKSLYVVGLVLLLVLGYAVYEFSVFSNERTETIHTQATATTDQLRDEIGKLLKRVTDEGQRLATQFGENDYSADEVRDLLKQSSLRISEVQGVTAAFEPFAFQEDIRLFSPYYDKGSQSFIQVEDSYDYTVADNSKSAWYTKVRDNGMRWVEPYYGAAAKDWYVDLGVPFTYADGPKKGQVRGTITVSFLCRDFGKLIHRLSLGRTGYGIITSSEGVFLAHPDPDLVGKTSLDDWVSSSERNTDFVRACQSLLAGKSGMIDYRRQKDRQRALFCFGQIPEAGWGHRYVIP